MNEIKLQSNSNIPYAFFRRECKIHYYDTFLKKRGTHNQGFVVEKVNNYSKKIIEIAKQYMNDEWRFLLGNKDAPRLSFEEWLNQNFIIVLETKMNKTRKVLQHKNKQYVFSFN